MINIPYFDNNAHYAIVSFIKGIKSELGLLDSKHIIRKYERSFASIEDLHVYEKYQLITYSREDNEYDKSTKGKSTIKPTTAYGSTRTILDDRQITLSGSGSSKTYTVNCELYFKSETEASKVWSMLDRRLTTNIDSVRNFTVPYVYRFDKSVIDTYSWVIDNINRCIGREVTLAEYFDYMSYGSFTMVSTEAGVDAPIDLAIKDIVNDNVSTLTSVDKISYEPDSGFYMVNLTYTLKLTGLIDTLTLKYNPTVYNNLVPTPLSQLMISKLNENPTTPKLLDNSPVDVTDYFYMIHPDDFMNKLPSILAYNMISSILLTKEYDENGDFIPIMVNLRELGDYKFDEEFLSTLPELLESKAVVLVVYLNGVMSNISATIDNEYNVLFSEEPMCDRTVHLIMAISDGELYPVNYSGNIICNSTESCLSHKVVTDAKYKRNRVQYSSIIAHNIKDI